MYDEAKEMLIIIAVLLALLFGIGLLVLWGYADYYAHELEMAKFKCVQQDIQK